MSFEIGLDTLKRMNSAWMGLLVLKGRKGLQGALGIIMVLTLSASATVRYVDLNCTNATPPFTNWATAAVTIQAAVGAATTGDQILVTNGVYAAGGVAVYGTMTNRVAVTKAVTVQSVNGPEVTAIQGNSPRGNSAVRCVYTGPH